MSQEQLYASSAGQQQQQVPSAGLGVRPSWGLNSFLVDASPSQGHGAVDFKTEMMSPTTTATQQQVSGTVRDVR